MMMGVLTGLTFSSPSSWSLGKAIQFLNPLPVREATIKKVFNPSNANKASRIFPKTMRIVLNPLLNKCEVV
jgi:hypothetical protein